MRILEHLAAWNFDAAGALTGTDAEAEEYARREMESPGAQEFVGGHGDVVIVVLLIGMFVLLYLFLKKEEKI